ncbi:MAG: SDR family NAD(P)-dependent oxidoreductase, partial [Lentisphaerae bacterium]|nr:SDR family NAD(P)-dependent oxidoreductase [Lentisphaerota bacterium]
MSLSTIRELSNFYGADSEFVLAGGGNTSYKDEKYLYVKPSGVSLAKITEKDFVKMERSIIRECFSWNSFADADEREARVKSLMAYAVAPGSSGRPSVEAPLHELMDFTFVVHLHPAMVNGMTCGKNGAAECAKLFPQALWVEYVDPGFTLAKVVFDKVQDYKKANGNAPSVIFLQNHGVFVGGNSDSGIRATYENIMSTLKSYYESKNIDPTAAVVEDADAEAVMQFAPSLRGWLAPEKSIVSVRSTKAFAPAAGPLTPDHIVYAKSFALTCDDPSPEAVDAFAAAKGYKPKVVCVPGKALFAAGNNANGAATTMALAYDAARVERLAGAFGGVNYLSDAHREFIENWEVESYRSKVAAGSGKALTGKVAIVTGGAQGFGYGIAEVLAAAGADVVIADMNVDGAKAAAAKLGAGASGVAVNIADEESVAAMVQNVVKTYGGADLFVANAGVLRAGSVKSLTKKDWDFVTNINYSGYFLCVKHIAPVMAQQNSASGLWSDIVQVNSKSGLVGSNRNGAYAGSKFGTIGLTQS